MSELKPEQEQEAEHRTSVRAKEIHEAIRRDGEAEMSRGASALGWSALAAGLAMGTSLLTEGLLRHFLPEADWTPVVAKLGYAMGFIIVIVGKQQLFTENTLTPIIPLMHEPTGSKLAKVLMLWSVVLAGNLLGAHLIAWFFGGTDVLKHEFHTALAQVAHEAVSVDWGTALVRGIPAGWLIALIVWLKAAVDSGELAIIVILTWLVGLSSFTHIIAGSVEYLYLVVRGEAAWLSWLAGYMIPVLVGNVVGGVTITAALNHAQVVAEKE